MSEYLITTSLINSFSYYMKDEWKTPEDSRADFLKTLSRERFEPNEAMQRGIDFENDIESACKDHYKYLDDLNDEKQCKYDAIINNITNIVRGGFWQESCKKEIQIGNKNFLLYGRCDVIKDDTIYDIKYTSKYDTGKFSDSIQHLIYLYCLDLPKFQYLVSNLKDCWIEEYFNTQDTEEKIVSKISGFIDYLERDQEASSIYYNKWKSYK